MKKNISLLILILISHFTFSQKSTTRYNQLVKFTLKPQHIETFKKAAIKSKNASILEPGNIEMKLYNNTKNEQFLYVYSRWKDKEAYTIHGQQPYTKSLQKLAKNAIASVEIMELGETNPIPNHDLKYAKPKDKEETLFFIFKVKDGYRSKILKQFKKHIQETNKEKGNIFFDLYTVAGAKDTFVVYEHWRDKNALWNVHMKSLYAKETGDLLAKALKGKFEDYLNFVTELK